MHHSLNQSMAQERAINKIINHSMFKIIYISSPFLNTKQFKCTTLKNTNIFLQSLPAFGVTGVRLQQRRYQFHSDVQTRCLHSLQAPVLIVLESALCVRVARWQCAIVSGAHNGSIFKSPLTMCVGWVVNRVFGEGFL